MTGESREIWQKRYEKWKSSGLSIAEFSRQNGLNDRSFGRWVKRFSSAVPASSGKKKDFIALPALKASNPTIQIRIAPDGEITIEVHRG